MPDLLYTGASGFLASNTIPTLKQLGYNVITLGTGNETYQYDIARQVPVFNEQYDIVFHAAGKAHSEPKTEAEKQLFYDVNFKGTVNVCKGLENSGALPKQFVFISTVAVYGLDSGELVTEEHALNGDTPYAKSKIMAEEWLAEWAGRNNVTLTILRLPLVAGANPPGNLGAMINGIRSGKYLSIGKATASKSIIWAEDIATILPRLAPVGGIYNITDGLHPTFSQLETVISGQLKKKTPLSLPMGMAKILGWVGDIMGSKFPVNSSKLKKITSTLTFDDKKLHAAIEWAPSSVVKKLSQIPL
ncbi:NAD-dependent epimerase/dehydratase family protein [Mucilaginibacter conchicola]|uniref:NAD-dependent epimerase/dehydratase family protein n=1 Tax=Mucilaginibacter conchicola TaxID=2303333 RepID=A0A372NZ30_9SPHI|nr:NAD-dependent epimerase/dehydratase family protein [Mucilaginibacter conchicola]RFZ95368.1 NAD-dependent epimerase/dehydratase family protein [Mucilaginibacter conchicola]